MTSIQNTSHAVMKWKVLRNPVFLLLDRRKTHVSNKTILHVVTMKPKISSSDSNRFHFVKRQQGIQVIVSAVMLCNGPEYIVIYQFDWQRFYLGDKLSWGFNVVGWSLCCLLLYSLLSTTSLWVGFLYEIHDEMCIYLEFVFVFSHLDIHIFKSHTKKKV